MIKEMFSNIPKLTTSTSSQSDANNEGGVCDDNHTEGSQNSILNETLVSNNVPITIDIGTCSSSVIKPNKSDPLALDAMPYRALPSFRDVPSSEKSNLFYQKMRMCCVVFNFTEPLKDLEEKEIKRQTLLELSDYITSVTSKFDEVAIKEITEMVAANLFRTLPSSYVKKSPVAAEAVELSMDPAWPHLEIVYEFLLRFLDSRATVKKLAKNYINQSFIKRLLDLFDSEGQQEREYLKKILHRIYGKFMRYRSFIREGISNLLYHFIFETEKHNGIAQLLAVLGSIINGFALPLKEEHHMFLVRVLIPLHKPKCLSMYHMQLLYCIRQFVERDSNLADTVIQGLLRYWPVTSCSKEVLFLKELDEVLERTQGAEIDRCMVPLFRQIGKCMNSLHHKVAEHALLLLFKDHIQNLIIEYRQVILPVILPALEKNTQNHWKLDIKSLTHDVKKMFLDADQTLFYECLSKFQEDEIKERQIRKEREQAWMHLESRSVKCRKQ